MSDTDIDEVTYFVKAMEDRNQIFISLTNSIVLQNSNYDKNRGVPLHD